MNRIDVLKSAADITSGDRNASYGDPYENHLRIAKVWSVILGFDVSPAQVALCMAGMKLARLAYDPAHVDSNIDGAAYLAIASECVDRQNADTLRQ